MQRILIVGEIDLSALSRKSRQISTVSTFRQAIATIRTQSYDAIIVDCQLSGRDGIFLAPSIKRNSPKASALLITDSKLWAITEAAKQLGFDEVLSAQSHLEELVRQVEVFLDLNSSVATSSAPSKIARLSLREREILIDISTGATTIEIARKRHNSEATIKSHLTSIYRKLEVRNRVEAIAQINS